MKSPRIYALLAIGSIALAGAFGRFAVADDAKPATCPVSGQPAKVGADAPSTHVNGQMVYFCCANCPKAFAADPEKYAAKMGLKCPVMQGNAVKQPAKNLRLAVNNGYVYFCCAGCPPVLLKSPEKFLSQLKDPVSGEIFKLTANTPHATYKGAHFYFANAQNKATFEADPAKYAHVLGS